MGSGGRVKTINATWFNDGSAFFQMHRARYFVSPTASLTAAAFQQILSAFPSSSFSWCIKELINDT
jgi:hypothetical protein